MKLMSQELSYEQEREIERLIALATLQRMRGQLTDAETSARKALDISPKDVTIRELLADILHESGKLETALSEYRLALDLAPGKKSLEIKFAKVTLEIAQRERERALAKDMLENPHKYAQPERSPLFALILALVPGCGQFYNRDYFKGSIILGIFMAFLFTFAFLSHSYSGVRDIPTLIQNTHPAAIFMGVATLASYIYGLFDAAFSASKTSRSENIET